MNIMLRGVPDWIYYRLMRRARENHRSLSEEILAVIETQLGPKSDISEGVLKRIRERRRRLPIIVRQDELEKFISDGRM